MIIDGLPDGQSPDDYAGYKDWTSHQWAWEFFRRKPSFIKACRKLPSHEDGRRRAIQRLRRKFALRSFKDFAEAYEIGKRPLFNPSRVILQNNEERTIKKSVAIRPGEILLKINLKMALIDRYLLTAQLNYVSQAVTHRFEKFSHQRPGGKVHKSNKKQHDPDKWMQYLRMIDARRNKVPVREVFGMVFPDRYVEAVDNQWGPDQFKEAFKSIWRTAKTMRDKTYLDLALPRK